uniref:Uncharacterized protein n=1 Tax=Hanusia phi TaxID=3032 RepID=A0A7S0DZS5_9CRYP|mmetsp:Transcript_13618/g.31330  ORF Transcript_13618/g.31330 Transcript_13618/m.31330 type:complete len:529 (+) Transcript_13618:82-1668(+)
MSQAWRLPFIFLLGILAVFVLVCDLGKDEQRSVLDSSDKSHLSFERLEKRLAALSARDKEEWRELGAEATRESEKGQAIESAMSEAKRYVSRMLSRISRSVDRKESRHEKDDRRLSRVFERSVKKAIARTSLALMLVDTRLSKYAESTKASLSDELAAVLGLRKKLKAKLKHLKSSLLEHELTNAGAAMKKDSRDETEESKAFQTIIRDAKQLRDGIVGSRSQVHKEIDLIKLALERKDKEVLAKMDSLNVSLIDAKDHDFKKFSTLHKKFRKSKETLSRLQNQIKALQDNYTLTETHVSGNLNIISRQLEQSTSGLQLRIHDLNSNISTDTKSVSALLHELKESRDTEEERLRQQIDEDRDAGVKKLRELAAKVLNVKGQQIEWTKNSMKSIQDAVLDNRKMKDREGSVVGELQSKIAELEKSLQDFNASASSKFDGRWTELRDDYQKSKSAVMAALDKARSQSETLSTQLQEKIQESESDLQDLKKQGEIERGSIESQLNSTISTAINLLVAYESGVSALEAGSFN